MTTPVDLDHLGRLHAAATGEDWNVNKAEKHERRSEREHNVLTDNYKLLASFFDRDVEDSQALANAELAAATHNALPALIAEVRRLRITEQAQAAEMKVTAGLLGADVGKCESVFDAARRTIEREHRLSSECRELRDALHERDAEARALRAFVQEVRETAEDMPPSDAYVGYAPLTHGRLTTALGKVPR